MIKKQQTFQSKILKFPENPESLEKSARIIENGGLMIFPTKGLYGIGADITKTESVQRIYTIKKRPLNKPILMLVKDLSEVEKYCLDIPERIIPLMEEFWPGDITFVFKASKNTPEILTGGTGKIGVRIPSHPFPKALLGILKNPITGTSANLSGLEAVNKPEKVDKELLKNVDIMVDSGKLENKTPSTIIEASENKIEILREGRVKIKDIKNLL